VLTPNSGPSGITAGADGALWFTEIYSNGKIGRITTEGAVSEYSPPTLNGTPYWITTGPDGALWFAEYTADKIGQIVFPTAVLSTNPESGSPGTSFTRTGSGFAPGESVISMPTALASICWVR
jgi:virginiamycin B lyase